MESVWLISRTQHMQHLHTSAVCYIYEKRVIALGCMLNRLDGLKLQLSHHERCRNSSSNSLTVGNGHPTQKSMSQVEHDLLTRCIMGRVLTVSVRASTSFQKVH